MKIKNSFADALGAFRARKLRNQAIAKASSHDVAPDTLRDKVEALHPGLQKANVESVEHLPSGFTRLTLSLPKPFVLISGTYCVLYARINGSLASRPYSVSSSPSKAKEGKFELCIEDMPGGFFSHYLCHELRPGDELLAEVNMGSFHHEPLRDTPDFVAIAGGGALTPFLSMAKEINEDPKGRHMKFFVAVRTRAEVLDFDELRRIASEHVEVIMVYSDEEVPNEEHGFVDGAMLLRHGCRLDQTYFVCGPGPMIPFLMGEFAKLGVASKFIRAENNAPITYTSEIENKVSITVHQGDRTTIILADPKEPLAVAIERSGNFIHTSCRHGHCGFCRIEVLSGDYAIPEGKDQRRYGDKALNVVHGCCTFPLSDLEIRIPIPAVDF